MATATMPQSRGSSRGNAPQFTDVSSDQKRLKTSLPAQFRHQTPDQSSLAVTAQEPLATFLGLFSIGLGLWEVLDPRGVAGATGVRYPGLLRAYGAREIGAGLGILTNRRPAGWLLARVAGDVMDLATIAAASAEASEADRRKNLLAAGAVIGVTVLDILAAQAHSRT